MIWISLTISIIRNRKRQKQYEAVRAVIVEKMPAEEVAKKFTPATFCNCSAGLFTEEYETVLEKSVNVYVKESVLRGAERRVFEISITR